MTTSQKQKRNILIIGIAVIILFLVYSFFSNSGLGLKTSINYTEYNGGYQLVSYTQGITDKSTEIIIPEQYEGKNVVAIADIAFNGNKRIKSAVIPNTVTELGSAVFKNCSALEQVKLSDNLEIMGGACFENCKSLKEIVLPNTLKELRGETFMGCSSLKSVVLPANIAEIKGNTFENCISLETIEIPTRVTRIGAHAFYGCKSLNYVFVPDSVAEIGSSAFRKCDSLEAIAISKDTVVNERAFKESPTQVYTKAFPDELFKEIEADAYTDFDTYVLYNIERGQDEIYCHHDNTLVVTTSEKFKEKHLKSTDINDLLLIEEYDAFIKYLQKAKDSGVTKVMFYAYSEKASEYVGEPYFITNEYSIDEFMSSLYSTEEE